MVQEQLATELGLSRVPVREALRTLEAEGLVEHRDSGGFVVATVDIKALDSIQRLRELLEAEAVRRAAAAGRLGPDLARQLTEVHEELVAVAPSNTAQVAQLTRSLHITLLNACDDPILMRIINNLWDSSDAWRTIYYQLVFAVDAEHRAVVAEDFPLLIRATASGDVDEVVTLIDRMRARGIAAAEAIVGGYQAQPQWQARQLAQLLQPQ